MYYKVRTWHQYHNYRNRQASESEWRPAWLDFANDGSLDHSEWCLKPVCRIHVVPMHSVVHVELLVGMSSLSFHLIIPSLFIPLLPLPCCCHRAQVGCHKHTKLVSCCMQCVMHVALECKPTQVMCVYIHIHGVKVLLFYLTVSVYSLLFLEYQPTRDFWRHVHASWHHLSVGE